MEKARVGSESAGGSKCIHDSPENHPGKALPQYTKSPSPVGMPVYPEMTGMSSAREPGHSLYFIHVSFHVSSAST